VGPAFIVFLYLLNSVSLGVTESAFAFRQQQLEQAVLSGDKMRLSEALAAGSNPNRTIDMSPSALTLLQRVRPKLVHYFAEETLATPLIVAAARGDKSMCALLIDHGAARFAFSSWGWVAAQYAARLGYPELAQTLFNADPRASHFAIEIELDRQKVVLLKDGTPIVQGRISTGRRGFDTPPGRYLVTDKERTRKSSLYKVPMPYFLRLSFSEYGIHQGHNPGRPASHGCIRVGQEAVARTLFSETPIGTLVTIQ
jgi:L,D-transpeptidase catalytic domain